MGKKIKPTLILFAAGMLLAFSCAKKESGQNVYYAVGKGEITRDEVDRVWMKLPDEMKYQYMSRQGRQELLTNLVNLELLYQEALREKLDQDPEIKFNIDRTVKNMLAQEVVERAVNPEELRLYFQENYVRLDGISFAGRNRAEAAYQDLGRGSDFKALKAKTTPSARDQELGYLNRDDLINRFGPGAADQVFGLGKDQKFTKPVETDEGWYVFYALEKPGNLNNEAYRMVEDEIINMKREEIFRGVINDLRSQIPIKANQKNINEFLQVGADWEKSQMPPEQGATVTPPAPGAQPGSTASIPGAAPETLPGATLK